MAKGDPPVMRMEHKAGDKLFIDFTGKKLTIVDRDTGELKELEVFVCILGSSQYTYVEACASQKLEDFIRCTENALWFYRGVPRALVPDNLKSAVPKSSRYEPKVNEVFADFAEHYETAVLPTRTYRPRDTHGCFLWKGRKKKDSQSSLNLLMLLFKII
ncbi:DDE-type integrase/transposase/recombinase [Muricauda sp. MAR_2010_75]|uniref:DDE-type integrase/transposase/recombinase n=1 Tax=Allomuricauda sp. MAR_2010_75 TaxID=1250232 RepID=UPI0009DD4D88|nr:DDE-type integrase/transposase/recombinase [Muricauda sp. MAR_2010_75]